MIVALAGGVGAARLLRGMVRVVPPAELTVVVNTGDDCVVNGLHVSPDLDTVMYTLAGRNDEERGWGLEGETWNAMAALEELGGQSWFRLGDRDLATHLYRTHRLDGGAPLSTVTTELCIALGVEPHLVPVTDDRLSTWLTLESTGGEVPFQEYFVKMRHEVAVKSVRFEGAATAFPAPGVTAALAGAKKIVVCPSNPVVSIGPILAVRGMLEALQQRRADVVAVSPIVAGAALKGPADRMLVELGEEASALGVARRYRDFAGTLVVDEADARWSGSIEDLGMSCVVAPTIMRDVEGARALSEVVLGSAVRR